MANVKIGDTLYLAEITTKANDKSWDGRNTKYITLTMSSAEAAKLWVDGVKWSTIQTNTTYDNFGNPETQQWEFDCSEYSLAGDIIDHRNGTVTIVMGMMTDLELVLECWLNEGGDIDG